MIKDIYSFDDYRKYLIALSGEKDKRSGFKSALAKAAQCFNSYMSKVLAFHAHLTLEQAAAISEFLGHNENQRKYFLLLVQKDKAGTIKLRKIFETELTNERNNQRILKNQLTSEKSLSAEEESKYYSNWIFSAIDVSLTVDQLKSRQAIAEYFKLNPSKVNQVVEFLISSGLVIEKHGRLETTTKHIHLSNDSNNIIKHHCNWRIRSMEAIDNYNDNNLHYSSVVTLSLEDFIKIKDIFIHTLKAVRKTVDSSPPEDVVGICVDLFSLSKS